MNRFLYYFWMMMFALVPALAVAVVTAFIFNAPEVAIVMGLSLFCCGLGIIYLPYDNRFQP